VDGRELPAENVTVVFTDRQPQAEDGKEAAVGSSPTEGFKGPAKSLPSVVQLGTHDPLLSAEGFVEHNRYLSRSRSADSTLSL
jgi:hypothetical protein